MSFRDVYTERKEMYFEAFNLGVSILLLFTIVLGTGFSGYKGSQTTPDLILLRDCSLIY